MPPYCYCTILSLNRTVAVCWWSPLPIGEKQQTIKIRGPDSSGTKHAWFGKHYLTRNCTYHYNFLLIKLANFHAVCMKIQLLIMWQSSLQRQLNITLVLGYWLPHLGDPDLGALLAVVGIGAEAVHVHLLSLGLQRRLVHHHRLHNLQRRKLYK